MPAKERHDMIRKTADCHVLVYAGDGKGMPAELLFSTGRAAESVAICRLLENLVRNRQDGVTDKDAKGL